MNPLVSLLRWSIKGMREECTRVSLVGLASQFYLTPSVFYSWKVGHTPSCGQLLCDGDFPSGYTGKYTIYFPGGAFDLRGCYGTSIDVKHYT